ncbi:MAG: TRAP transporter substrate-binding protein [Desulfuromonadales bacterium]|nr:TRAP transporter substrate-binding protein [Desulfuromonadales bacterium]
MKLRLKKLLLGTFAVLLASGGAVQSASALDIVFAISAKPGSMQYVTAEEFTSRANDLLGDKAKVVFYGSEQLGKDKDLMQKLKLGTVHLAMPSSVMSSIAPEAGLFDMPFLVKDRAHLNRIEHKVFWPMIAPAIEAKGYKVIGFWENGIRHITNNVKPINTPADLKGVKIRTPKSTWRVKMFSEWGANPTPMSFSEVFVALQTGVIDGQENPYTNIDAAKLNEVQKYLSITGHVYTPSYLTAGASQWEKLPADVRAILEQTAVAVQGWMYATGTKDEVALVEKLGKDMQVNVADRAAFVEASKPIYAEFAKEVPTGKAMVDMAMQLAD